MSFPSAGNEFIYDLDTASPLFLASLSGMPAADAAACVNACAPAANETQARACVAMCTRDTAIAANEPFMPSGTSTADQDGRACARLCRDTLGQSKGRCITTCLGEPFVVRG